jgi:hypothetical protein
MTFDAIIGEIRPVNDALSEGSVRPFSYRIFNGEAWVKISDPSVDKVWDLLGYDAAKRAAIREYYGPPQ